MQRIERMCSSPLIANVYLFCVLERGGCGAGHAEKFTVLQITLDLNCALILLVGAGQDAERVMQRNEGKWNFTLKENSDETAMLLEVEVGRYLDTSLIKVDVQPLVARLIIKVQALPLYDLQPT